MAWMAERGLYTFTDGGFYRIDDGSGPYAIDRNGVATLLSGNSGADDGAASAADVTCDGTPGVWVELIPAASGRLGASVQAIHATANCFILAATTKPADGKRGGERQLPPAPALFTFPYAPKKRHWIRSDVASAPVSLVTW